MEADKFVTNVRLNCVHEMRKEKWLDFDGCVYMFPLYHHAWLDSERIKFFTHVDINLVFNHNKVKWNMPRKRKNKTLLLSYFNVREMNGGFCLVIETVLLSFANLCSLQCTYNNWTRESEVQCTSLIISTSLLSTFPFYFYQHDLRGMLLPLFAIQ